MSGITSERITGLTLDYFQAQSDPIVIHRDHRVVRQSLRLAVRSDRIPVDVGFHSGCALMISHPQNSNRFYSAFEACQVRFQLAARMNIRESSGQVLTTNAGTGVYRTFDVPCELIIPAGNQSFQSKRVGRCSVPSNMILKIDDHGRNTLRTIKDDLIDGNQMLISSLTVQ